MTTELKKAFELIKENCSKEEQIKALFTNDKGDIDLMNLKLIRLKVFLSGLEAKEIFNQDQIAEGNIDNKGQQAGYFITNEGQESRRHISNARQKAINVCNNEQEADEIQNYFQKKRGLKPSI